MSESWTQNVALYANMTAGQTATIQVLDAGGNHVQAKQMLIDVELQDPTGVTSTEGKTYFAYNGAVPVVSQRPGYYANAQIFDNNITFTSAKAVTAGVNIILLLELRGNEDISGSTITVA